MEGTGVVLNRRLSRLSLVSSKTLAGRERRRKLVRALLGRLQEALDGLEHEGEVFLGQLLVHGDRERLRSRSFTDGERRAGARAREEARLPMQRKRVVDRALDAFFLQVSSQRVSLGKAEHELMGSDLLGGALGQEERST